MKIAKTLSIGIVCLAAVSARAGEFSQAPFGYIDYCARNPDDCVPRNVRSGIFRLTPEKMSELNEVNHLVNTTYFEKRDQVLYGQEDYWTLPDEKRAGDCEDFALKKRKLLLDRGWPSSALLLTGVITETGEGHLVLVARTDQGDFVLDNKRRLVQKFEAVPYTLVGQQSTTNPKIWLVEGQKEPAPSVASEKTKTKTKSATPAKSTASDVAKAAGLR